MGAVIGNKNGRGKKGRSGRKPYLVEKANRERLAQMFFEIKSADDIKKWGEKHSVEQAMIIKAWSGDVKAQTAIFQKLYPDMSKFDVEVKGKIEITPAIKQFAAELSKKLEDADE